MQKIHANKEAGFFISDNRITW